MSVAIGLVRSVVSIGKFPLPDMGFENILTIYLWQFLNTWD